MRRQGNGILICDDSDVDAFLLRNAFLNAGIDARPDIVSSGDEAVMYLMGQGGMPSGRCRSSFFSRSRCRKEPGWTCSRGCGASRRHCSCCP